MGGMLGRRHWNDPVVVTHPGRPTPGIVRGVRRFVGPFTRLLYRPRVEGLEHLPKEGPFLIVANHSAGLGIAESLSLAALWLDGVGEARALAPMLLPTDFRIPGMAAFCHALGGIPSTKAAAEETLRAGVPVLVFPGGDHDALRPIWKANVVDFGGRVGFARIARDTGVPIVPLGIRGSHVTSPPLIRSPLLAWFFITPRLLGSKRWAISLLGVVFVCLIFAFVPLALPWRALLAWIVLGSPMCFWPWLPARIRFCFGPAMSAAALFGVGEDEQALARGATRVEQAVQALVRDGR